MAGTYKVFVKNGDYGYNADKTQYGNIDYNYESDDFSAALLQFLDRVDVIKEDEEGGKVTLTFRLKDKK